MTPILRRGRATLVTFLSALAGSAIAPALLLALMASAATFVALDAAHRIDTIETAALRQTLTGSPRLDQAITSQQSLSDVEQSLYGSPLQPLSASTLGQIKDSLNRALTGDGLPLAAASQSWIGLSADAGLLSVPGTTRPDVAWLVCRDTLAPLHLTAGSLPQASKAPSPGSPASFDVALSQATATAVRAHVGSVLTLRSARAGTIRLTVTGVFVPADARNPYWTFNPGTTTPYLDADGPTPGVASQNAMMFVAPQAAKNLELTQAETNTSLETLTALDLSKTTAGGAHSLLDALTGTQSDPDAVLVGPIEGTGLLQDVLFTLHVGPIGTVSGFVGEQAQIATALSLVTTSLEVLGVILMLLCIRLVADRRADDLAMMRARGASRRALAAQAGRAGLISVPCVIAVTVLTDGRKWIPAVFLAALAVAGPAVLAVHRHGRIPRARTAGQRERRTNRVRQTRQTALTAAVIAVCVGSVLALRYDVSQASDNAFVGAAPLLIAVPLALVLLHAAPPIIRTLAKCAAYGRGVVGFVGLTRAAPKSAATLLPSAALILAFAVIALGSTIRGSIAAAETDASWRAVGADAAVRVQSPTETMPPNTIAQAMALPGVTRGASAYSEEVSGNEAYSGSFTVLVVDPAKYQAFTGAGLALPAQASTSGPTPVLLSPTLASAMSAKTVPLHLLGRTLTLKSVGTVKTTAALPAASAFVIVPAWAFTTAPPASILLLDGQIDPEQLAAVFEHVPGAEIALRSTALDTLARAPLQEGVFELFNLGIAVALACCAAALAVSLSLHGPARTAGVARLATMGLSRFRLDLLVLTEQVPPVVASLIGGALSSIATSALIGPTLDLSAFSGTPAPAPRVLDLGTFAEASAAIAAAAALTLLGHAALTRRRGVAKALRLGDR